MIANPLNRVNPVGNSLVGPPQNLRVGSSMEYVQTEHPTTGRDYDAVQQLKLNSELGYNQESNALMHPKKACKKQYKPNDSYWDENNTEIRNDRKEYSQNPQNSEYSLQDFGRHMKGIAYDLQNINKIELMETSKKNGKKKRKHRRKPTKINKLHYVFQRDNRMKSIGLLLGFIVVVAIIVGIVYFSNRGNTSVDARAGVGIRGGSSFPTFGNAGNLPQTNLPFIEVL